MRRPLWPVLRAATSAPVPRAAAAAGAPDGPATKPARARCGGMELSDLVPSLAHPRFLPHIRDLAIAYALAFLIGWNREQEDRSAGVRTFPLVAIAACGFVQATEELVRDESEAMARIIEGVITGIGFIGGGAILKGAGEVHGTATAAALWATGAIGIAVGVAAYDVALVICLFTVLTFYVVGRLKSRPSG
jgi:putative Mg2+ transporter-C (MgtC) family protein